MTQQLLSSLFWAAVGAAISGGLITLTTFQQLHAWEPAAVDGGIAALTYLAAQGMRGGWMAYQLARARARTWPAG